MDMNGEIDRSLYLLPQVEFLTIVVGLGVDVARILVVAALHVMSPHLVNVHTRAGILGSFAEV